MAWQIIEHGKTYYLCRNTSHFKSKCTSQRRQVYETKHNIAKHDDIFTDYHDVYLNAVHIKHSDTLTALLELNECKVLFQIDTGA